MMNAMLQESGVAQNLWGEVLLTTYYILNKIPHTLTGKMSYEHLKVWGCLAKVAVPLPKMIMI